MLYISYQGIYDGTNYEDANTPKQINKALGKGYSCLIDVWRIDNKLYLGNGQPVPQFEVSADYIKGPRFWINAKNEAMQTGFQINLVVCTQTIFGLIPLLPLHHMLQQVMVN